MLSVQEVLNATGIARATLYRMIDEGLPYRQVGLRKKLFNLEEVLEFMAVRKNDLISKLEVGKEYYNEDLCAMFKCSTQGGMRRSHSTGALVLTSHHDDPTNAYMDYWCGDIFYYTGMGMEGDQDINYAQNKTLANSNNNGIIIYLFEVFNSRRYMYRGIVKLTGEPFIKDELDFSSNIRKVWKFPLKLVNQEYLSNEFIIHEQVLNGRSAHNLSDKELFSRATMVDGLPRSRYTKSLTYEYNWFVREYVKRRANGRCQLCRHSAPFKVEELPFLKTVHIISLSKGGKDCPENVAALCPNCYDQVLQLRQASDVEKIQRAIAEDELNYRENMQ